ncbi:tape measure protein [Halopseudomonas sp. SMJS2]|uniref:tape measure protein n=1 Tax=Halopseudomonas sp. SMJS2 TaxID=3041098 RepID=UPI0024537061|nr:tape measure protein [Halopseudomonas sp. SMJS2]WGK60500.1 tape measure protein [Halopseudomonas sp. SMJS2]
MTEYARLVVSVDSTQVPKADGALKKLGSTAKAVDSQAGSLGRTIARLAAPLAAFLSVRAVIRASDEYGQMAARMRMATASSEEYVMVQERLIQTAQRTYRPLTEAQELYIRTADALKSLGHDTEATLDITDSFSYLLVTNAASADRAASSINAYSKAIQTGRIDSETWQTLLAAMPTIVDGIADATGKTTQEIRQLGITGKLSLDALNESLRRTAETNGLLADSMETSVGDAVVTLQNSFNVLIGQVNESTGASGGLITSIESLAELLQDPDTIQGIANIASGLVTLTSWLIQAATATYGFFDALTDGLAGIRHLTEVQRMEEEVLSLQVELNNLTADLMSPDWLLSIRGLDRGQIEAQAKSLQLMIKGLSGTLQEMKGEEGVAALNDELDSVLEKLGGFREGVRPLGLVAAATAEADREAKKLASSYDSASAALARQVALYGQNSEAARINYEITKGSLQGIAGDQIQYLEGLAAELDAKRDLTEQEQLRIQLLRETGQLRAANDAQFELEYAEKVLQYEKAGNIEAAQRLKNLRAIREIQMNADQAPGTVEGVSQAPQSQGADAMYGGATGELVKLGEQAAALEAWRASELEKQRGFLELKEINEEAYAERVRNIHEQHNAQLDNIDSARRQVALSSAQELFGTLTSMAGTFAGEQSGVYKAMFAVEKAAAIARSIVAIQGAIASASMSLPFPANLGAMATVAASTAGIVSTIASTSMSFDGGGYTGNGPRVGGLDGKGGFMAMVHPRETIIDHTKQKAGGGGGKPDISFTAQVVVESQAGMSQEESRAQGEMAAGAMRATFMSMIEKESRPGGMLWRMYGGGR